MGRLLGLEVHNFKLYRGTTRVGFGDAAFTLIVGPNGAGKLNMMDAILFVLGVPLAQLRLSRMLDLVYRGRLDDPSALADPLLAFVSAIYQKADGSEIALKREVKNGHLEYQVDGKTVSAQEYLAVLAEEQILVKLRNFLVFQGDVELVASQLPKQVTAMIEAISGSGELRDEYDQARDALERATEALNLVFSRKRTLGHELRQYREQAEEQHQFEEQLRAKRDQTVKIALYRLFHNEKTHQDLEDKKRQEEVALEDAENQLEEARVAYKEGAAEHARQVLQLKSNARETTSLAQKIDKSKRELVPVAGQVRLLMNKVLQTSAKIRDLDDDIERQHHVVTAAEKKHADAERQARDFEIEQGGSGKRGSQLPPQAAEEYEKLRKQFLSKTGSELEEQMVGLLNDKHRVEAQLELLERQQLHHQRRIDAVEGELALSNQLESTRAEIAEVLDAKKDKTELRTRLVGRKEQCGFDQLSLQKQLRDVLVKLDELASKQRELERQRKLRENVALLKKLFPQGAIKGIVSELIEANQLKYATAIATAVGANSSAVVVLLSSVAYKAISILKERRLGILTFIPLDSLVVDARSRPKALGSAVPAADLCLYDDPLLELVVLYVMGDTLVVDSVDAATELKFSTKVPNQLVTLDGAIIHRQGYMTGGVATASVNTNWNQLEMANLQDKKEELQTRLAEVTALRPVELEVLMLTDEIQQLDDRLPQLRALKTRLERAQADRHTEIGGYRTTLAELTKSSTEKREQLKEINEEISELEDSIAEALELVYQGFCDKYGFESIDEYERTHGLAMRQRSKAKMGFARAVTTLANKLEFERDRLSDLKERQELLRERLSQLQDDAAAASEQKEKLEAEVDEAEAQHQVVVEEVAAFTRQQQKQLKATKALEAKVKVLEAEVATIELKLAAIAEETTAVAVKRVNLLKNCRIDNVAVPLEQGVLEELVTLDADMDELVALTYDIQIDYDDLDARLQEQTYLVKAEAELVATLEMINDALDKLTPNAKARDRLAAAEEKMALFDADHAKARQNERKLRSQFDKIKQQRYDKFHAAYSHIASCIDAIYKELTMTDGVGGQAHLALEDDDEPYLAGVRYHAMPPHKRFKDMELLLGGEKTMAALALLFAIHLWRPLPFFVLDEIDAALDNANVARIVEYIRNHAGPDFQFIVISLKNNFYSHLDALVGIYREQEQNSSKTVTMDLREYPEEVSV